MSTKKWLSLAAVLAGGAAALGLFYAVFLDITHRALPWWAYIFAAAIYFLVVYLGYLLWQNHRQHFQRMLDKAGFSCDKRYDADGQTLCIDFAAKRLANTYLSTKPFVPFCDVADCRIECYQTGSRRVLDDDRRYLSVVISVVKTDPSPEHPYLYLSMFEEEVAAEDVPETPDVTEQMVAAYPQLQPMLELKRDICSIIDGNKTAAAPQPTVEQPEQIAEPTDHTAD